MSYKVKTIPKFEKELKRLAKKYHSLKGEYIELVQSLKEHPEQGTPLGNGCITFLHPRQEVRTTISLRTWRYFSDAFCIARPAKYPQ